MLSRAAIFAQRASRIVDARGAALLGGVALLFAASVVTTILWCASMSAMALPMPGGWALSMAWVRMCGESSAGAAASFLVMWAVMMLAMMLPSLLPMLRRDRAALLTLLIGLGYLLIWILAGMALYPLGVALAALALAQPALARAVPLAVGVTVLLAGALQLSAWKARQLACCRAALRRLPPNAGAALCHGLRLGLHCAASCAGLTAILLVMGVMDLRVMTAVAAAITAERLAPAGRRVARVTGLVALATGLFLIARAAALL